MSGINRIGLRRAGFSHETRRAIQAAFDEGLLLAGDAPVTQPQGELARLIGASRERVNKTLAVWRERGWIEIGRTGTRVVDRTALAALTQRSRRR